MTSSKAYLLEISELRSLDSLEPIWRSLEAESTAGFYLSWPWMRTWLSCLPSNIVPQLLTIHADHRTVALGVLTKNTIRRHRILKSRTWALHTTALGDLDCIFIEHNGLLTREADRVAAWRAWAMAFAELHTDWDEIKLAAVPPEILLAWSSEHYRLQEDMRLVSRYVDLDLVRQTNAGFLMGLGTNTRARIRYTHRTLQCRYGEIQLASAADTNEAFSFYEELRTIHQRSWIRRGQAGAFAAPFFNTFHQRLIRDYFDAGCIQLIRVTAGRRTIGMLYNFVHGSHISMYQSGFDYSAIDAPNKQSPGLLTHALAIQHSIDSGYRRYDFLAGDNQYKQVLANCAETMWWGRVQRHRFRFRLEELAGALWRARGRMSRLFGNSPPALR